jgi:multidrug transporter EmrE-like cation transporter
MSNRLAWFCVTMTILFTVYGQMVARWQAKDVVLSGTVENKAISVLCFMFTPWMLSVILVAFLASLCWVAAMTRLPLTTAYPFMSLPFVVVAILSATFLNEPLGLQRILGIGIVMAGLVVLSRA